MKKRKYIWSPEENKFLQCQGMDKYIHLVQLHSYSAGLSEQESQIRRTLFGENDIKVPVHSIPVLLVKEILTPFYVFQVFSVCFWYADDYWLYASAILVRKHSKCVIFFPFVTCANKVFGEYLLNSYLLYSNVLT